CMRGDRYLSPLLQPMPEGDATKHADADGGLMSRLSRREREIASLVIQGSSSLAIANCLHISLKTVETHRAHINRKLGIHSSSELIRLAAIKGLLAGQSAPTIRRGMA